jgi:hypothetical protein
MKQKNADTFNSFLIFIIWRGKPFLRIYGCSWLKGNTPSHNIPTLLVLYKSQEQNSCLSCVLEMVSMHRRMSEMYL